MQQVRVLTQLAVNLRVLAFIVVNLTSEEPFAKRVGSLESGALPKEIAALLPGEPNPFITVVHDPSTPRPGTDELYLRPSGEQSEVEPAPIVHVVRRPFFIPIEGVLLVAGFGGLCFYLVRRTRRAQA